MTLRSRYKKDTLVNVRYFLGAGLLAAAVPFLLAGCSGAASSSTTPGLMSTASTARAAHDGHSTVIGGALFARHRHDSGIAHTWMKLPQPPNPLLYVSDPYGNFVNIYSANGDDQTAIGQIAGFDEPQGLWVDINQNLWVVNTNTQQIMGFHRGSGVPFKTFDDTSGQSPAGVCGNNNKHLLYSVDISGPPPYYIGNTISVFNKAGSSNPIQTFTDSNASSLNECAVDSKGNLFVTLNNVNYPYAGEVDEFLKNSTTPIVLVNNLVYPIGITVDKYRTLAVDDAFATEYSGGMVYLYDWPYTSGPAFSFSVPSGIIQTALTKPETQLWGAYGYGPGVLAYSYPHGLLENQTDSTGLTYPDGIALSPAAKQ